MDGGEAVQKKRKEEDLDGKYYYWCSRAEETNQSKNKLIWKKNSTQTLVERFQLFILM